MIQIKFFDILFLLAMVAGAGWGFYRGLFRQSAATLILYIATVCSTLMYRGLSRILAGPTGQTATATDMLAFVILMAVLTILFMLMVRDLLGSIDIDRMGIWVNVTGMAFGFFNAAIWCAVILMILRSASGGSPWIGYVSIQRFVQDQTHNSWMAYVFRPFIRLILTIIRPWLFGHALPPLLLNAL